MLYQDFAVPHALLVTGWSTFP